MEVEEIEKTFARLEELVISMPRDPLELGPDYLREQISICRGYLNEVSVMLQRLLKERTLLTIRLESLEAEFSIKSDELLTGDNRVRSLPALADRQAMINNILVGNRREISGIRLDLQSNGHIEKVVRLRHKELDNTMSALRLQRSLLRDQLRTGSFYGDESNKGRDDLSEMSGTDLDALLASVEEESFGDAPAQESTFSKEDILDTFLDDTDDVGVDDLQNEVDALVDEGGLDETPPKKPLPVLKRKGEPLKTPQIALTGEDIDQDMHQFLEQDFLDSILENI